MKEENIGKRYKTNEDNENVYVITKGIDRFYLEFVKGTGNVTCILSSDLLKLDFEEVVDWSKVAVDTKILVADCDSEGEAIEWKKRHFAKYENGIVYAWVDGKTSFTAKLDGSCMNWDCAKLYKEGDE